MQKSIESFLKKSNETSFSEGFVPVNRNQLEGTVNNASVNNSDLTENSSTPSAKKRYRPDKDFEFRNDGLENVNVVVNISGLVIFHGCITIWKKTAFFVFIAKTMNTS